MKLWPWIAVGVGVWLIPKGRIMQFRRLTSFGGQKDVWDRTNGNAYLPSMRPQETPAAYYARVPAWVRDVLRPEMAHATETPTVIGKKYNVDPLTKKLINIRDVWMPLGVSGWLDEKRAMYAAWHKDRMTGELARAARAGRLWVVAKLPTGEEARARVVDAGPVWRDTLDVSPAFQALIKPHWPVEVELRVED